MMEMMPIMPIYSSTFNQMGMGVDGVLPPSATLVVKIARPC